MGLMQHRVLCVLELLVAVLLRTADCGGWVERKKILAACRAVGCWLLGDLSIIDYSYKKIKNPKYIIGTKYH